MNAEFARSISGNDFTVEDVSVGKDETYGYTLWDIRFRFEGTMLSILVEFDYEENEVRIDLPWEFEGSSYNEDQRVKMSSFVLKLKRLIENHPEARLRLSSNTSVHFVNDYYLIYNVESYNKRKEISFIEENSEKITNILEKAAEKKGKNEEKRWSTWLYLVHEDTKLLKDFLINTVYFKSLVKSKDGFELECDERSIEDVDTFALDMIRNMRKMGYNLRFHQK